MLTCIHWMEQHSSDSAHLMSPIVMLYLSLGELAKENTPQHVAAANRSVSDTCLMHVVRCVRCFWRSLRFSLRLALFIFRQEIMHHRLRRAQQHVALVELAERIMGARGASRYTSSEHDRSGASRLPATDSRGGVWIRTRDVWVIARTLFRYATMEDVAVNL